MNPDRFLPGPMSHGIPKLENPLSISWHDSSWIPMLNTSNVMEYFSERTNPFYDRTCNNENLKMQRLGPEHLGNMVGLEYCLLHVQEPILYVIRKQHRHSPNQVTPISDYYILAGIVYQAPDLASVIGSRMLTTVHHLQSAFDEAASYSHYHPSKGYWWEFKDNEKIEKAKVKEEPGSAFQRRRVDILLSELAKKFPPKLPSPPQLEKQTTEETTTVAATATPAAAAPATVKTEPKIEIKTEKADTPPASVAAPVPTPAPPIAPSPASLPPPPPPPPPSPAQMRTVGGGSMKPPPEKKPRLA